MSFFHPRSLIRSVAVAAVLGLGMAAAVPAVAQTIASKVDYIGQARHLQITGLLARDVNGLLNVQMEVSNSDDSDQQGYYRIDWVDEGGFSVAEEAWKPILLHGGGKQKILAIAPTLQVRDFKIQFSAEKNWAGSMGPAPVR